MSASAEINRPERRRDASIARNSLLGTPFFATARLPQRCREEAAWPTGRRRAASELDLAVAGRRRRTRRGGAGGLRSRPRRLPGPRHRDDRGLGRGRRRPRRGLRDAGRHQPSARDKVGGGRPAIQDREDQSQRDRRQGKAADFQSARFGSAHFRAALILLTTELLPEISGAGRRCPIPLGIAATPARIGGGGTCPGRMAGGVGGGGGWGGGG